MNKVAATTLMLALMACEAQSPYTTYRLRTVAENRLPFRVSTESRGAYELVDGYLSLLSDGSFHLEFTVIRGEAGCNTTEAKGKFSLEEGLLTLRRASGSSDSGELVGDVVTVEVLPGLSFQFQKPSKPEHWDKWRVGCREYINRMFTE